jgi:hypothetical protein
MILIINLVSGLLFLFCLYLAVTVGLFALRVAGSNSSRYQALKKYSGSLKDVLNGSIPVYVSGDRRFECQAGAVVAMETGLVRESARLSDDTIEASLAR